MNAILETFRRPRVFLPVIHCRRPSQVAAEIEVARRHGGDGVFLINQGGMDHREVMRAATRHAADFWVGVNLLGVMPTEIFALWDDDVAALWSDGLFTPDTRFKGRYFGGAAFKGQWPVPASEWGHEADKARCVGADVVTTSGVQTGRAAPIVKVQAMRHALGDHALGLASGVSIENVADYLPYVDAYLVASSIEREFGRFDPGRMQALADAIHAWGSA